MMSEIGNFALTLSFLACVFAIIAGIYAAVWKKQVWFYSARASTTVVFLMQAVAIFCLGYCFVTNDYSNQYVWQFSNRDMDWIYKISAIWGGMDGSMLLWAFILATFSAMAAIRSVGYGKDLAPWTIVMLNSSTLFFIMTTLFWTNPFRFIQSAFIPPDGNGLNPLLQNPLMAIHPPMLYCGFTLHAIPAAIGFAALLSGNMSNDWVRIARPWALLAWTFLTAGIILGGHWAYVELGWGGFWAWDPVENSSFLPWLVSTAFIHSLMVQERRGMLKLWNIWLVISAYGLTVFGTFLTRSGIVQSVHSFASTDIGWKFLVYLGAILFLALVMTVKRWNAFRPERSMNSFWSRESLILFNNLIFVAICFGVFWGVMFPVFSEAITGTKQAVGIPFFNAITIPLFLVMLLLMGTGPLISWGKEERKKMYKLFGLPFIFASLCIFALLWAGFDQWKSIIAYGLIVFIVMGVMQEIHRAFRIQRAATKASALESSIAIFRRHPSRFGGHIVHLGVAILTFGITASMTHKVEKDFVLEKGKSAQVGRFNISLRDIYGLRQKNYEAVHADLEISRAANGEMIGSMQPELRTYFRNSETTTEVALRTSLREDLYVVLAGVEDGGTKASFKVFINPFQVWLWFGAIIMLVGSAIVIAPVLKYVLVFKHRGVYSRGVYPSANDSKVRT